MSTLLYESEYESECKSESDSDDNPECKSAILASAEKEVGRSLLRWRNGVPNVISFENGARPDGNVYRSRSIKSDSSNDGSVSLMVLEFWASSKKDDGVCLSNYDIVFNYPLFVGFLPSATGYTAAIHCMVTSQDKPYETCIMPARGDSTGGDICGIRLAIQDRYLWPLCYSFMQETWITCTDNAPVKLRLVLARFPLHSSLCVPMKKISMASVPLAPNKTRFFGPGAYDCHHDNNYTNLESEHGHKRSFCQYFLDRQRQRECVAFSGGTRRVLDNYNMTVLILVQLFIERGIPLDLLRYSVIPACFD